MAKTTDGLKIIDDMIGNDEELKDLCDQATVYAHVAQQIYDLCSRCPTDIRCPYRSRVESNKSSV